MATSIISDTQKVDKSSSVQGVSGVFNVTGKTVIQSDKIVYANISGSATSNHSGNIVVVTGLPKAYVNQVVSIVKTGSSKILQMAINTDGEVKYLYSQDHLANGEEFSLNFMYICK